MSAPTKEDRETWRESAKTWRREGRPDDVREILLDALDAAELERDNWKARYEFSVETANKNADGAIKIIVERDATAAKLSAAESENARLRAELKAAEETIDEWTQHNSEISDAERSMRKLARQLAEALERVLYWSNVSSPGAQQAVLLSHAALKAARAAGLLNNEKGGAG